MNNQDTLAGVNRPTSLLAPTPGDSGHRGAFRKQGVKQRIYWQGKIYPSISAASKAAGVSRQSMSEAIRRNRLHTVGTGPHRASEARKQPCAAHGWHWQSQKEAAAALGVSPQKVSYHLECGIFERLVKERLGVKE